MAAKSNHCGVFVRTTADGQVQERVAGTPADAVALTFDGWQRKPEASARPAAPRVPQADAPQPADKPSK